jgi:hypothetical protein
MDKKRNKIGGYSYNEARDVDCSMSLPGVMGDMGVWHEEEEPWPDEHRKDLRSVGEHWLSVWGTNFGSEGSGGARRAQVRLKGF